MTLPNADFTNVAVTSLQGYSGTIADNVTGHNAMLRWLNKKGNINVATGRTIVQELEYAENGTVGWYSGSEIFDTSPSEFLTAPEYSYKQLVGSVVIDGLEEIKNSGKEAIHNLLKAKLRNLDKSLRNEVARSLYATGTGNDGKEIGGLRLIVADTPTNTVGGIDASAQSWWASKATNIVFANTTIQGYMNTMFHSLIRDTDKPDVIMASPVPYMAYLESLQVNQRFADDKKAGAGFTNLVYMGDVPVIYDSICPADRMYFLNTDYLYFRPAKGRSFKPLGDRASINQDAIVMPVVWAGNMTCSNRGLQGVLY